jgi:2OG-Fe(II) oxygenase superfamily
MMIGAGAATVGGVAFTRTRRAKLYRELSGRVATITSTHSLDMGAAQRRVLPSFDKHLAVLPDFLPPNTLAALRAEADRLSDPERNYVPTHKKGGTIAYETLIQTAPGIVSLYHSSDILGLTSRLVGVWVGPTPIHDQSSLSLLVYNKPGDHIGWHFDHNFYRGRHFTLLLALVNTGQAAGGLSHAMLRARLGGREVEIATAPNTLVIFEGALVQHDVTPIHEGERRVMLSMTYCNDPRAHWWQAAARRVKDTAFYGVRALWT